MTRSVAICRMEEVGEGRGHAVEVEGHALAVFRDGDAVFVLGGRCPHAGGAMGSGWVEDGAAVCPLHRWEFRLRDGRCRTTRGYELRTFPCEVRDGIVHITLPSEG